MLWFNLIFGLNFVKPVYFFQTSFFFFFSNQFKYGNGVQRWRISESTSLSPLWSRFDSQIRRHMWVKFVGSLLCTMRFSPGRESCITCRRMLGMTPFFPPKLGENHIGKKIPYLGIVYSECFYSGYMGII